MRLLTPAAALLVMLPALPASAAAGWKPTEATLELYKTKCSQCHMLDGNSALAPMNFADGIWKHGDSLKEIEAVISEGVPATAMLPFKTQITPAEIAALARYVRSFDKKPIKPAPKAAAKKATASPAKP